MSIWVPPFGSLGYDELCEAMELVWFEIAVKTLTSLNWSHWTLLDKSTSPNFHFITLVMPFVQSWGAKEQALNFAFCCQNQDSRLIYCNTTWQTWQCVNTYKASKIWTQIYRNQKILNNQDLVLTFENFKNTKYNNHALNLGCFFMVCYLGCIVWGCRKGDCTLLAKKVQYGSYNNNTYVAPFL